VFIERDLSGLVAQAVRRLVEQGDRQEWRFVAYKGHEFSDREAHDLLIRALDAQALPVPWIPAPPALPGQVVRHVPSRKMLTGGLQHHATGPRRHPNQPRAAMQRTLSGLVLAVALGVTWMALAGHDEHGKGTVKVTVVSARDVTEKLDGKAARVTTVEVSMEPGVGSPPHRHAGPVFGYVLEGDYEWGLDDQPAKTLKVGETFYEPTGALHRVSRNPSAKGRTRVLAVILHPRDAKQLTIPEPPKK
jgi:quercetin dioxygenase-like cupin family protein